jgi:hypothetical protein
VPSSRSRSEITVWCENGGTPSGRAAQVADHHDKPLILGGEAFPTNAGDAVGSDRGYRAISSMRWLILAFSAAKESKAFPSLFGPLPLLDRRLLQGVIDLRDEGRVAPERTCRRERARDNVSETTG